MPLFAQADLDAGTQDAPQPEAVRPISIAILAMGGEGGGVLADWIVDLAEHNEHIAQATSVAGVAQRTGATIYYVEIFPRARAEREGAPPLLGLMPAPGDVDVVIASELMEAGRAVHRGLVTPDRTTLIASTHRVLSIPEKSAMGEGAVDSAVIERACAAAARRFVRFDMSAVVERSGSVISAVLFGALSATGALPFTREQFEQTIERGGVGVRTSLAAFAEGRERAAQPAAQPAAQSPLAQRPPIEPAPASHGHPAVSRLLQRLHGEFKGEVHEFAVEGVRRLLDYQDPAYAGLYLDRLSRFLLPGRPRLAVEVARHLALWMSYEDTIRVADLKTRSGRFARVQAEARVGGEQLLSIHEYLHPRLEEICDTLPASLGRWLQGSRLPRRLVERHTREGRVVTTSSLGGFLLLRAVAAMRRWRRTTLRFVQENERIEHIAAADSDLAVEVARCQRLVKGYGDTRERGSRNFEALMQAADGLVGRDGAAATLLALHEAALADDEGATLRDRLARLEAS